MKLQFVAEVSEPVLSYGVMVSTGDVVEFEGWLAEKAKENPNYRLLDESEPDDLDELRAQWEAKFGKKPHHKKSANTLREELSDGD